ncbi:MAG: hypothetical protein IJV89_00410 [Lentisphaeria bacterium]|nr:hypothetical protein [Lentisphaeria bacterium]
MVKRKMRWVLAGAVLLGSGIGGWYFYNRNTPEAQIRKVIAVLASSASKMPGEGGAASVLKVHSGTGVFTDPARIEVAGTMFGGDISQAQIQSHLARYRSMMESAHVTVEVEQVILTGSGSGEVLFTGTLRGRTKHGTQISEVRELRCEMQLGEDGVWKIRRLTAQDILEK